VAFLVLVVIFWVLPIFVGRTIGRPKNRSGGWWGFCLGWLGVIIVALLPPRPPMTLEELERKRSVSSPQWYEQNKAELLAARTHRECPFCKEEMRRDASVCPHCRNESPAWTQHEERWWANVEGTWYWLDESSNSWQPAGQTAAPTHGLSAEPYVSPRSE
jgi:hypothetical protein